MSDLTYVEKQKLEKLFGMRSGYVLDFSDRTFQEFIVECVSKDIYDKQYNEYGSSKAKRLRAFWKVEPNHVVGKLIHDLIDFIKAGHGGKVDEGGLVNECSRIAIRLGQGAPVNGLDVISEICSEKDFESLGASVRSAIVSNKPENALDRLHTFVLKYMRLVCQRHNIAAPPEKPLHSLCGEYVKFLKAENLLETSMTERILKSTLSTFHAFNDVRNNLSLAHDNPLLNYQEALFVTNNVMSCLSFIAALEKKSGEPQKEAAGIIHPRVEDDLPF